jgi:hypothetical protein
MVQEVADAHVVARKQRKLGRDEVVETKLGFLHQRHDRCSCELFRDRADPVACLRCSPHAALSIGMAITLRDERAVSSGHDDGDPGDRAFLHLARDDLVDGEGNVLVVQCGLRRRLRRRPG